MRQSEISIRAYKYFLNGLASGSVSSFLCLNSVQQVMTKTINSVASNEVTVGVKPCLAGERVKGNVDEMCALVWDCDLAPIRGLGAHSIRHVSPLTIDLCNGCWLRELCFPIKPPSPPARSVLENMTAWQIINTSTKQRKPKSGIIEE